MSSSQASAGAVSAHILVVGRVHGVYFRASMAEEARGLRVTGWVQNLADGRVEATAEGLRADVERLVAWCQHGPPTASVEKVDVTWADASGAYRDFDVRCQLG